MIREIPDFFKKSPTSFTVLATYNKCTPFPLPETLDVRDTNGVKVGVAKNLQWEKDELVGEIHYEPGFSTEYLLQYADPDHRAGEVCINF